MITVATRTKEGVPALYRVDEPTWEEARDYVKENVPEVVTLLALVPKEAVCHT